MSNEIDLNQPALPLRPCPVCNQATGRQKKFEQRFFSMDQARLMTGYDVVVCQSCGGAFADRIPEQSVFDQYYRSLSKYENHESIGRISDSYAKTYRDIVDRLEPLIPLKSAKIIDIGCAAGGLLAEFQRRGYTSLLGVDPSPSCVAAAQKYYGIQVLNNTIADMAVGHAQFDVVLFTGVLEHVRETHLSITQLKNLLAPRGLIAIAVPDVVHYGECRNAPFQQFSVEHINFFSPQSLTNLMSVNGFKKVDISQTFWDLGLNSNESGILGVYQQDANGTRSIDYDHETELALSEYVRQGQAAASKENAKLVSWVAGNRPLFVWGVGTLTQRLLAQSPLSQANVTAFIDSNRNYQGKQLMGRPIIAPSEIAGRPEPILICSWMYQQEISRQIREKLRLPNELLLLYDV